MTDSFFDSNNDCASQQKADTTFRVFDPCFCNEHSCIILGSCISKNMQNVFLSKNSIYSSIFSATFFWSRVKVCSRWYGQSIFNQKKKCNVINLSKQKMRIVNCKFSSWIPFVAATLSSNNLFKMNKGTISSNDFLN